MMPSSSATPACVAMPPLLLFLHSKDMVIIVMVISIMGSHGFIQGLGFFVSSMRPDMFFRKRLCMFFSSISLSLQPPKSTWERMKDNYNHSPSMHVSKPGQLVAEPLAYFIWNLMKCVYWTMISTLRQSLST